MQRYEIMLSTISDLTKCAMTLMFFQHKPDHMGSESAKQHEWCCVCNMMTLKKSKGPPRGEGLENRLSQCETFRIHKFRNLGSVSIYNQDRLGLFIRKHLKIFLHFLKFVGTYYQYQINSSDELTVWSGSAEARCHHEL